MHALMAPMWTFWRCTRLSLSSGSASARSDVTGIGLARQSKKLSGGGHALLEKRAPTTGDFWQVLTSVRVRFMCVFVVCVFVLVFVLLHALRLCLSLLDAGPGQKQVLLIGVAGGISGNKQPCLRE
jgi:hypothetical protein